MKLLKGNNNQKKTLLLFAIIPFIVELTVMLLTHMLPNIPEFVQAVIDSSILAFTIFVLGSLYLKKANESRKFSDLYTNLSGTTTDIILFLKDDGSILEVNNAASKIYGYSREMLLSLNICDLRDPETNQYTEEQLKKAKNSAILFETRHKTKGGKIFPVEANSKGTTINDEHVTVSIVRNISERKATENELLYVKQQLESFLENATDAIQITDTDGKVSYVNNAYEQLFGWQRAEVTGKILPIVPEETVAEVRELIVKILGGIPNISFETVRITRDGNLVSVNMNLSPIKDVNGKITSIACIFRDVTERKKTEESIRHSAYHDYLTGLPNRRLLDEYLTNEINKNGKENSLAVAFLDIDGFKDVNDILGHAYGDILLKDISQRLLGQAEVGETVGRVGGDEFLIIKTLTNSCMEIEEFANRIFKAFAEPWTIDNHAFHISASIGIALYPENGQDALSLMKNADTAMFNAKNKGKNCFLFYDEEMRNNILKRLDLENKLRHALELEEFEVYYQPKIDARSKKIIGLEALLRWKSPELGMVSPVVFIPIAEATGLIISIGKWVLQQVCRQINIWSEKGFSNVPISVNISPSQFHDTGLVSFIKDTMENHNIKPDVLGIEITESTLMQEVNNTSATLNMLKKLHISIAIDDFGTGYSSLSYLQMFPIDVLKIDRSFVKDITNENGDVAITKAIISLAENLNIDILAEGIETEEQSEMLEKLGCFSMQGFLYHKPMPVKELEEILN